MGLRGSLTLPPCFPSPRGNILRLVNYSSSFLLVSAMDRSRWYREMGNAFFQVFCSRLEIILKNKKNIRWVFWFEFLIAF